MKIISAKFVTSIVSIHQIPAPGHPEIAFAGRSNVGKSSLINCLVDRKNLALTSSSPGKTRTINFFNLNEKIYFVDLPGYGFAKVPVNERQKWQSFIEAYITSSKQLKGIIQIIDSRIGATELDLEMLTWLSTLNKNILIVASKIDKLSNNERAKNLKLLTQQLTQFNISGIVPFSAITKTGKQQIWKAIDSLIGK
jgi:GTP-binding protein